LSNHTPFEENLELYALGALEDEESRAFAEHLKACSECAARLGQIRSELALVGLGAPTAIPPVKARQALLESIRAEKAQQATGRRMPTAAPPPRLAWLTPVALLPALVLGATIVWLGAQNERMTHEVQQLVRAAGRLRAERDELEISSRRAQAIAQVLTASDTLAVTLSAAEARPAPQGRVFYNPAHGLIFYAANFPALPEGRIYQLWLVPASGNPVSAGVFNTDQRGNGSVVLPSLPKHLSVKAFVVTVEPGEGQPQPTGKKVLIGRAS
jgi:anti-sigma-K factor RskA